MKCQGEKSDGTPCDFSSDKDFHFCPTCGGAPDSNLSKSQTKEIPCPGTPEGGTCGKTIKESYKFCPECGWKVDIKYFKNKMKCPRCSADCTEGSKFCSKCGFTLSAKQAQPTAKQQGAGDADFDVNANTEQSKSTFQVHLPPEIQQDNTSLNVQTDVSDDHDSAESDKSKQTQLQPASQFVKPTNASYVEIERESEQEPPTEESDVTSGESSGMKRTSPTQCETDPKRARALPLPQGKSERETQVTDFQKQTATIDVKKETEETPETCKSMHVNLIQSSSSKTNPDVIAQTTLPESRSQLQDKTSEETSDSQIDMNLSLKHQKSSEKPSSLPSEKIGNTSSVHKPENKKSAEDKDGQTSSTSSTVSDDDKNGRNIDPNSASGKVSKKNNTTSSPPSVASVSEDQGLKDNKSGTGNVKQTTNQNITGKTGSTSDTQIQTSYSQALSRGKMKGPQDSDGKPSRGNQNANKYGTKDKHVEVVFHAFVSEMDLNHKKDEIFVRCGPDSLGGFSTDKWKMVFEKERGAGIYQYSCRMAMTQEQRKRGFKYKYVVKKPGGKMIWEEPYYRRKDYRSDENVNRLFWFPSGRKQCQDIWHQYDGFIYFQKTEKSRWERFKNYFKGDSLEEHIRNEAKLAVELFMPSQEEVMDCLSREKPLETRTAEDLLDQVFMVYSCLSKQLLDKKLNKVDEKLREEAFLQFFQPLRDHLRTLVNKKEQNATDTTRLVLASFLLLAAWENDMSHILYRDPVLMQAFLPQPNFEEKTCPDVEAVKLHFKTKASGDLVTYLCQSINSHSQSTYSRYPCESQWMYLVPLLHFLRKDSEPFKGEYGLEHTKKEWWGHEGIDAAKDTMKAIFQWTVPVDHLVKDLEYLFEADHLLPRTLMACVSLQHLKGANFLSMIPPAIGSATFHFYLKSTRSYLLQDEKRDIARSLNVVAEKYRTEWRRISESEKNERRLLDTFAQAQQSLKVSIDVLDVCLREIYQNNQLVAAASSLILASLWDGTRAYQDIQLPSKSQEKLKKCMEHLQAKLNYAQHLILEWLPTKFSFFSFYDVKKSLWLWNALVSAEVAESFQKEWRTTLLGAFERILGEMNPQDCLKLHFEQDALSNLIQDSLTTSAFTSFEKLVQNDDKYAVSTAMSKKFGDLMSKLLVRHWPKGESTDTHQMLNFILSWSPLKQFFERFYGKSNSSTLLSQECISHLAYVASILDQLKTEICSGEISIANLRLILNSSQGFLALWSAAVTNFSSVDVDKSVDHDILRLSLQAREKELTECENLLQNINCLLNMAVHIDKVDSKMQYDKARHVDKLLADGYIKDICEPIQLKSPQQRIQDYSPKLSLFDVTEEVLQIVPQLEKWKSSAIFQKLWEKESKGEEKGTNLNTAILNVWMRVKMLWLELCSKIVNGTATFGLVQKHINMFQRDEKKIRKEFKLMDPESDSPTWIDERIMQLKCYEVLQSCQKSAEIIMEIRKIFQISGDFKPIATIQDLGSGKDQPMKTMSDSVLKTCKILEDMNDLKKQECIKAFKESQQLVIWLRESMKGGLKELKVFVDLAFISAGEEPMEIHKVNCFHAATTGYAPLIFNTPQDCDYDFFLQNCQLVWREMKADPKLSEKLIDTKRHLPWLQQVKQSHGSVEVTALTQAGMINSKGLYRIGNLENLDSVTDLTLNKVISLHVAQDISEDSSARKYNYDQLVDLQSRLMLVAGQAEMGKENVDHFIMVLDGIVRLAKTYIHLVSDGCVLFNCWKGKFLCGEDRRACSFLEFGLGDNLETLKGHRDEEGVEKFVLSLANQFDEFHEDWLKYVSDKRDEYLELNHYTIDQLVFLQKELIKLGSEDEPSLLVYPMLSLIKPDCTIADLTRAMQNAKDIVFAKEEEAADVMETNEPLKTDDPQQAFMDAMLESDFTEKLARLALDAVGPDIDNGIVWCMEHQDDIQDEGETEKNSVTEDVSPHKFAGWQVGEESVSSSAVSWVRSVSSTSKSTVTVKHLIANLETVWTKFLEAVSSSVADYLSLQHLGIILRELAKADDCVFARTIPPPLKCGIPNLIVCPQVDMMNAVIYLYKHTDNQPLPKPDEVLLCTPQTTFDQVDIFLRRAFFSNPGKAYTLANADLLLYEIEERTEKKLKEYATRLDGYADYQLVVLCSTENEFKARIVAALERNRCPPPPLQNLHDIRQYLKTKFSQTCEDQGIQSASSLDFENSNVRVIKSKRAGVGKSLYKKRLAENLKNQGRGLQIKNPELPSSVTIHLYNKTVSTASVAERLLNHTLEQGIILPRIFHLDISYEVQEGVDYLLFNLLILGCISNKVGHVWLKSPLDLYLIETIPIQESGQLMRAGQLIHPLLEVLPDVHCWSPQDSLQILTTDVKPEEYSDHDSLFDDKEFRSEVYQRPYQYLKRCSNKAGLAGINPAVPEGSHQECLQVLLQHCGVRDPAWSELHNFVWFLNTQLVDFEKSVFCSDVILEDLPGFPALVLQFLIQMSRDFATRSLVMSEQSPLDQLNARESEEDLAQFQMKRTWESSPHPYIFFNPDGHTMTFLGFNIDRETGNMVDLQTGRVLERGLVPKPLQDGLRRNRVNINENFDLMQRLERLEKLCNVMPGVDFVHDPDDTYELTTDNVKKILAIYMRFRCGIPVIIMGETGCGKTRLVKFMCSLQCPPGSEIENMVIMKVHGGTTSEDIIKKVKSAEKLAAANKARNPHMYTVLFFDEANTTESIGLIKEIMCDGAIEGQPLKLDENLKIVAACNPYRKHSDDLIRRLETAGLGYHVDADKTTDKLGRVPMRRLVYRVQPLPQSMLPLVWDFGQLNTQVEELYVKQMVNRYVRNGQIPAIQDAGIATISRILIASQDFMRRQADECSFVSLRDVDRTLSVMAWFYQQSLENGTLFEMIDDDLSPERDPEAEEEEDLPPVSQPTDMTKSLILALSVCYRASLRSREDYDRHIIRYFQEPCSIPEGIEQMVAVIHSCQNMFVDEVQLDDNIAKNLALKENLFMMVVCIELRIPLFLVGKPGSSKSLAKTIVADAMQGNTARSELFKQLKQAQMVSFQCSPLATAGGIVGTFRQCARYQQDKDLSRFVSIVVLDEVGLAEDSPRMPLKTLHPLLEDGCQGDEKAEPYKKVAFIGISNWALDPAKMNRGILVQREVPDDVELVESAEGICSSSEIVLRRIKPLLPQLAEAYKTLFHRSQETKREFFGLRDFYSLVKMLYAFADTNQRDICWHQLIHAVLRNFGGLDNLDPVVVFKDKITTVNKHEEVHDDDPNSTTIGLIEAGLFGDGTSSESRYLLLLTENYGALGILQQQILAKHRVMTIFGSSFPKDQEYTQICRNINRIKVCMETGNTVILLNLENLYESLYDALNQYYARLGGERFVDLGLGTHRVKCRVHQNFRLIVVAEKQKVYEEFPIPLINRLEKHFLTLNNMMTKEQMRLSEKLKQWALDFVTPKMPSPGRRSEKANPGDAFMGYHPDTAAAIVLQVWGRNDLIVTIEEAVLEECQKTLLWCATPASVVRLTEHKLHLEAQSIHRMYLEQQKHDDIFQYLSWKLFENQDNRVQAQITTHSKLLTDQEKDDLAETLEVIQDNVILLTLQSFDTEQQFAQQIKNFIQRCQDGQKLVLIQCGSGDKNQSLIKSAQYCVLDELPEQDNFAVVFIIQLPNIGGGCFSGFQAGKWHSLHLDELRPPAGNMPSMQTLHQYAPSSILEGVRESPSNVQPLERLIEPMDYDLMGSESLPHIDNRSTQHLTSPTHQGDDLMEVDEGLNEVQRSEVVGIDDVVLEEAQMMSELDTVAPYFQDLLLPCIQSAAALIKDETLDSKRSTKRIEILLSLLDSKENSDAQTFIFGLSRLLISLLREKEEKQTGILPTNWLSKEAAKPENVRKAGTFRRAAMQCLENKITPILAGVVAFLDTHRNLEFMFKTDTAPWTLKLWLEIIKNTKMCHSQCKSIIAPGDQYHQGEVSTLDSGSVFSVETPFFWLLYKAVGKAITEACSDVEEPRIFEYLVNIISKTDYGQILRDVIDEGEKSDMVKAYLVDYVQTVYYGKNPEEQKILRDALCSAARQCDKDLDVLTVIQVVVYIHLIHAEAKERFHLFLEVEQVWPEVVHAVSQMKENVAGNPLLTDSEMTLDVLSGMLLLEQLEPTKEQLNSETGRMEWMERVKTYLPVIEKIINTTETDLEHGPVCKQFLHQARCLWMRVVTMKLFLECFTGNPKVQLETRCMPLWKMLGNETDLSKIESLDKVERFLKIVNKNVVKKISGKIGVCIHCETDFESPPVELPCRDLICLRCFNDMQVTKDLVCPKCQKSIPKKFKPGRGPSQKTESFQEYQVYLKCCNNFLMLVVSKLCFGGNDTPESAVIERIFSYITRKVDKSGSSGRKYTKEMSVFDDMIDPTPVVRSFLLQLLIDKNEETVRKYLQDFFHQAQYFCQHGTSETSAKATEQIFQFSLLVIHCFEDLYHKQGSSSQTCDIEMKDASLHLRSGRDYLLSEALDMPKMFTIAQCRYGLTVAAHYLNAVIVTKRVKPSACFKELLQKTADLLLVQDTEWPKKFLIKQICREFGTDSYYAICDSGEAPWLKLDVACQVKECPDRYVVYLEYQKVREALAKTLLGEDIKHLKQLVKDNEMLFLLAIHREVTMRNIKPATDRDRDTQGLEEVMDFIRTTKKKVIHKELALKLFENAFGRPGSRLNVQPRQSARDQSLVCLLFSVYTSIIHFNNMQGFLKPLADLISTPQNMMGILLPTMPQDDMDVVRQGLAERESVVIYRCPKGHPYAIGECGRPYTVATCFCGERIGGEGHQEAEGNVKDTGADQTRPGHILGRAADRTNTFAGERRLEGATCAVLRFFTHAALMLGTETQPQAVAGLVTPPLQEDVGEFFWSHLQKDLEVIHLATGKSVDDVFLLLHFICQQITVSGSYARCGETRLTTKQERENWEDMFAKTFIRQALKDLDTCLGECNERILKDKRIGQDKLMSILYEVDKTSPTQVECLHEFPAVWRYRSRITLDHFLREFNLQVENDKNRKSRMAVLSLFRKEHPFLQALHSIPNILRLQQTLMSKYHRRLDRAQAKEITIGDVADDDTQMMELMSHFSVVWDLVKESLHSYGCWTVHDGLIHLPDTYKNMKIDENSPLAVLLPSTQGPGICSYMTLEFLFKKHNTFMQNYCNITKMRFNGLPEVSVRKLHSNHLVSYHPDHDLLPIVLANCNYSFELGKGTKIDYDFEGFEHQLRETILQAKSRVEQNGHVIPIETVVYRADMSSSVVFKTLRYGIAQESLAPAVRHQIITELKSNLPDICDSINNLDIAISFLKSLGGEPEKSLQTFMVDSLKMKKTVLSQKARQFCRYKHAQSLWLLLSFEKSVVLAQHAQDAFDNLDGEFKEKLPDSAKAELKQFCQNKGLDKLEYLLQQIFDCLLLRVAQTPDAMDQDALDMKPMILRDLLQGELDAPLYSKEPEETLTQEDIAAFPGDILGKHIPDAWITILREIKQRRKDMH